MEAKLVPGTTAVLVKMPKVESMNIDDSVGCDISRYVGTEVCICIDCEVNSSQVESNL